MTTAFAPFWGPHFPDAATSSSTSGGPLPAPNATTESVLRGLVISLIEAIVPLLLAGDAFRRFREDLDFSTWAESHAAGALRRFSVRDTFTPFMPQTSNTDVEWREVVFELLVAYPRSFRYGADGGRDRDDTIVSDRHQIESAVGLRGFANLPNATFLTDRSPTVGVVVGKAADLLRLTLPYGFYRSMP